LTTPTFPLLTNPGEKNHKTSRADMANKGSTIPGAVVGGRLGATPEVGKTFGPILIRRAGVLHKVNVAGHANVMGCAGTISNANTSGQDAILGMSMALFPVMPWETNVARIQQMFTA
jgi:hypothetical protein